MMKVMKKGIVLPFLLLLASVAFILGALFLLNDNPKASSRNPTQSVSPSPTAKTISTDEETANWKTYSNGVFSFKYPPDWNSFAAVSNWKNNHVFVQNPAVKFPDGNLNIYDPLSSRVCDNSSIARNIKDDWLNFEKTDITFAGSPTIMFKGKSKGRLMDPDYDPYFNVKAIFLTRGDYCRAFSYYSLDNPNQEKTFDKILSTFKFQDQPDEERVCGGIAGIICPSGYECLYDSNYPNAGGTCAKK